MKWDTFAQLRVTLVLKTNTLPTSNNYVAQNYTESIAFSSDKENLENM